jgi:hypothetical protein
MCEAVHRLTFGHGLRSLAFANEEPHMRRLTENLSPEDRRFYWKFVGGLFGLYGALMVITVGMFVGNHLSKNLALEPAAAVTIGEEPPPVIKDPTPVRHAANYD